MTQNPTQRAANDTALKPWESIVAKILTAAFFSSVVYLAEKLIIQLIASEYSAAAEMLILIYSSTLSQGSIRTPYHRK